MTQTLPNRDDAVPDHSRSLILVPAEKQFDFLQASIKNACISCTNYQLYQIPMQIFAVVMGVPLLNSLFWRYPQRDDCKICQFPLFSRYRVINFRFVHFPISHILGAQTPGRTSETGASILSSFMTIATRCFGFQKLHRFGVVAIQQGLGLIKMA